MVYAGGGVCPYYNSLTQTRIAILRRGRRYARFPVWKGGVGGVVGVVTDRPKDRGGGEFLGFMTGPFGGERSLPGFWSAGTGRRIALSLIACLLGFGGGLVWVGLPAVGDVGDAVGMDTVLERDGGGWWMDCVLCVCVCERERAKLSECVRCITLVRVCVTRAHSQFPLSILCFCFCFFVLFCSVVERVFGLEKLCPS